ncbi:GntR family transcriptional regulator [Frigoribacterium sp. CFBP9039]|uniref:GntR family transcriptional regulator n=1 Tax=Frigoribacterium TaxID=96492 RepID=UPI0017823452|nr:MULTISPECIES: GntR family transcriptional regulator [Frigoribacterium]MBD8704790.1 GntR family transcriptional regulator [Frigoribacterium sp. CFBP 13712]MCJ0701683.1 GntR family transcriptional regulator [Frigoribacterium faeni]MDY0893103.1 GntR family transcriptional regulator [Frigoribacterium sp. CFBP9030]MDY0946578.1 GntR family transcriptional regulator [Frigoribacterium sp. CFBP9039]
MPQHIVDGSVPKHEQLRGILQEMAATELPAGAAVPSERQLMADYGVSRITVREAVGQLVNEGWLTRVRGKGTFVAHRVVQSTLHLASFTSEMTSLGHVPSTVVLVRDEAVPPADTAAALEIAPGETAFRVKRLRLADGEPVSIDDAWFPAARFAGLFDHDLTLSLYRLFGDEYDLPVTRARQTVSAEGASAETATLLGTRDGAPVLFFDRVSYSGDVPVEHSATWYRSDRYRVSMQVSSTEPQG